MEIKWDLLLIEKSRIRYYALSVIWEKHQRLCIFLYDKSTDFGRMFVRPKTKFHFWMEELQFVLTASLRASWPVSYIDFKSLTFGRIYLSLICLF